jgi:exosortase/archaeosortase family protein
MARRIQKKKALDRKNLIEIVSFIIKLNILAIPLWFLIYIDFSLPFVQTFLAHAVQKTLIALGTQASVEGFSITVASGLKFMIVEINMDCTGWKSLYALTALTIATPFFNAKNKTKFLIIALPILFIINFLRIAMTIEIGVLFGLERMMVVHTLLWREGLIAIVIIMWYLWMRKGVFLKGRTV